MKNNALVFGLAAILAVFLFGCSSQQTTVPDARPSVNNLTVSVIVNPSNATNRTIEISGFAFIPGQLPVFEGAVVTWANNDSVPHTVVADDGSFNSGALGKGQSWNKTFEKKGTYSYHCGIHTNMKGTVIVQ